MKSGISAMRSPLPANGMDYTGKRDKFLKIAPLHDNPISSGRKTAMIFAGALVFAMAVFAGCANRQTINYEPGTLPQIEAAKDKVDSLIVQKNEFVACLDCMKIVAQKDNKAPATGDDGKKKGKGKKGKALKNPKPDQIMEKAMKKVQAEQGATVARLEKAKKDVDEANKLLLQKAQDEITKLKLSIVALDSLHARYYTLASPGDEDFDRRLTPGEVKKLEGNGVNLKPCRSRTGNELRNQIRKAQQKHRAEIAAREQWLAGGQDTRCPFDLGQ